MRSLLLFALLIPSAVAAQDSALSPFARAKARTLLREQTACLGCHEVDGEGGRSAPSLTNVAQRRDAAYIRAIIADPQRVVPGSSMPKPRLSAATLELITRYVASGARAGPPPPHRPLPTAQLSPQSLYSRWCVSCHGPTGRGDGPNAPHLLPRPAVHTDSLKLSLRPDDALYDAIAGGGSVMGKSPRMPAFAGTLTSAEIRALVGYIRELCACQGPGWSRDNGARVP